MDPTRPRPPRSPQSREVLSEVEARLPEAAQDHQQNEDAQAWAAQQDQRHQRLPCQAGIGRRGQERQLNRQGADDKGFDDQVPRCR